MSLEKIILVMISWCFYNTTTFQIFLKISGSFSNLLYRCAPHAPKSDMPGLKDDIALE